VFILLQETRRCAHYSWVVVGREVVAAETCRAGVANHSSVGVKSFDCLYTANRAANCHSAELK
jgi:hypothetical protein